MEGASEAVQSGVPIRTAAKQFGIAETTLRRHNKDKNLKQEGRPCKFSAREEETVVDLLLSCADLGSPFTKTLLIKIVLILGQARGTSKSLINVTWSDFLIEWATS
jgi:helix-turn-helix, Psq domain